MGFFFDREKAEQTIWNRLKHLTALKKRCQKHKTSLKIGVLGNYYNDSTLFSSKKLCEVWMCMHRAQQKEAVQNFYHGNMLEIKM